MEQRRAIDARRLAYISEELVNWCPGLGTVLANEEVTADGRSDVGNYPVYRRPLRQWMLRITAFAERLIDDLDLVDWPESVKLMQRNWIGASDGAYIDLPVAGHRDLSIQVFTTRPDTLYGATYVVLAPEHPLVDQLIPGRWPDGTPASWTYPQGRETTSDESARAGIAAQVPWSPRDAVTAYRETAGRLSDRQRTAEAHDKTGVFTGTLRHQPDHRGGDPRLPGRLRAHRVRHRRDHGRPRSRSAGPGLRPRVWAGHPRGTGAPGNLVRRSRH